MEQIFGITLIDKTKQGSSFVLSPSFEFVVSDSVSLPKKKKLSLKNKLRYKLWKHLGKKLRKKGIIA